MAGDVVRVVVGLQDVLDAHPEVAREPQVLLDVELRVDDRRDPGVLVADQVTRAAEVVVGDLPEDHAGPAAAARILLISSTCSLRPPQTCSQSANTDSSAMA